jgi:hypothetical protein
MSSLIAYTGDYPVTLDGRTVFYKNPMRALQETLPGTHPLCRRSPGRHCDLLVDACAALAQSAFRHRHREGSLARTLHKAAKKANMLHAAASSDPPREERPSRRAARAAREVQVRLPTRQRGQ